MANQAHASTPAAFTCRLIKMQGWCSPYNSQIMTSFWYNIHPGRYIPYMKYEKFNLVLSRVIYHIPEHANLALAEIRF